jgi:hypothetical protein
MSTDRHKAQHQYELFRWCYENGHDRWVEKASRCFSFYRGDQWDARDIARLAREGRPHLTLNVVESLVRSMKGVQRALRNDVRFLPVSDATVDDARVRDMLWLHTQNENDYDSLETELWEKGLIMARAYLDVRVDFDDSTRGHVKIRGKRSQDVVLDPSCDTYDPVGWPRVFDNRWVSFSDLKQMFGKEKAEAVGFNALPGWYDYEDAFMSQQMGQLPYYRFDALSDPKQVRAYRLLDHQYYVHKDKDVFIDTETGDVSEIPETWDREKIGRVLSSVPGLGTIKRKMKTVRWCVSCEGELMFDDDSPYKWFTTVPFFPTFIDGETMGVVEHLLDPQMLYNKITSSELHIISTTANSGWKFKSGSLKNMTPEELQERGASTGFVAELADVEDLQKITPNSTPQGHDRLSFKADQIMRSLSGVSDQGRGFAREDVAGQAILANQAAQDVNFASFLANLHRTKQLVASRVLDCIQAHYTDTRVVMINQGSAFRPEMNSLTINEPTAEGGVMNDVTQGRYTTTLVPAPSRSTLGEEDFNMLLKLRELGVAVPDAMLIELSPAANKSQMIQALQGDSNERDRAAEEAAARIQQLEEQLLQARMQKEATAAQLNQARALKSQQDAARDPDESYRAVEAARIESNERIAAAKLDNEQAKLGLQRRNEDRKVAVKLTEIETKREVAEKAAAAKEADADRRAASPKKPKAPAARNRKKG